MRPLILASAFLAATAVSTTVLAPVQAQAQSRQSTAAETDFRQSVGQYQRHRSTAARHHNMSAYRSRPYSGRTVGSGGREAVGTK
jgi:hypothetical protein